MARHQMQRSDEMARAIHNIRIGNTRSQIDQAREDKMLMAGAQATAAMINGTIQAQKSQTQAINDKNRGIMSGAIDSASRGAAALRSAPRPPSSLPKHDLSVDEYGLAPNNIGAGVPSYDKQMNSSVQGGNPDWLKSKAEEADNNQALNMAAAGANIGGYRTPAGAEASDADSDMRAANLQTGKNILDSTEHMGGMMSSLPMRAR